MYYIIHMGRSGFFLGIDWCFMESDVGNHGIETYKVVPCCSLRKAQRKP